MKVNYRNRIFRLTKPFEFTEIEECIKSIPKDYVLVKPTMASICAADIRYYTGERRPRDLKEKLPMALLHESLGIIIKSNSKHFQKANRVVIVPNVPCYINSPEKHPYPCDICKNVGENYCPDAIFKSSGYDGFSQNYILHPAECTVKLPKEIPDKVAVYSELISVVHNIYKRIKIDKGSKIVIFGDGSIGYIISLFMKYFDEENNYNICVVGKNCTKLKKFDFVNTISYNSKYLINKIKNSDIVFEAIGGINSQKGINTAIRTIKPGGKIILVGVSETLVPVNTRDILAKGLHLIGTSRSETKDFCSIIPFFKKKEVQKRLKALTYKIINIKNKEDLKEAFDFASKKNEYWGKFLLKMHF